MDGELAKGLEGVVVAQSELSDIDGTAGTLLYRGYDIEDLATGASYEEVLYLLWTGALPTEEEFEAFTSAMATERSVDDCVLDTLDALTSADERP
ncbi:MAG: citrate synthase, partial [Halovenus sp.]